MTSRIYDHLPLNVGVPVAPANVPSFGSRFQAGRTQEIVETDANNRAGHVEEGIIDEIYEALPENVDDGTLGLPNLSLFQPQDPVSRHLRAKAAFRYMQGQRQQHPDAFRDLPITFEELEAATTARRQAEYDEANAVTDAARPGFGVAEFLGAMSGALTDELTVTTLPAGAPARAGVAATIGIEAAVGAAGEAALLPRQAEVAGELQGVPAPNPLVQIGAGALLGGAFGALSKGLDRVLTRDAAAGRPEGVAPVDHAKRVAEAEADLDGTPAPPRRPDRPDDAAAPHPRVAIEFGMGPNRPNRPDQPILDTIGLAVEDVLGPNARVVITSGREAPGHQHGSNRHGTGMAADFQVFDADGRQITMATNPDAMRAIARAAANRGARGIGLGSEYMGGAHLHVDMVEPGAGQAHSWGSEGRAMRPELVGIMDGTGAGVTAGRISDTELAGAMIGAESGGRAGAANPGSSAAGLGQFIDDTWLDVIRRHRPDLAEGRTPGQILALRRDADLARQMVIAHIGDNRAALRAAGLRDGPSETYLAHFAGQVGAIRILRADSTTPIAQILSPGAIGANAGIRHNGVLFRNMTAGQLIGWAGAKMRAHGATPRTGAPAPQITRRGYTTVGQVTAGDHTLDVEYQVVDIDSLAAASGDLQPRDRSRVSSDEQIATIAATLDPARLMPAPEADRGAPIVGPDNIVESGNGRVAAIRRAATEAPDRAAAYRTAIEDAGYAIPEGIGHPILIGRRISEMDGPARQAFVRAANTSTIARMSATERAAMDARAVSGKALSLYRPDAKMSSAENAAFARAVLDGLPQSERAGLVTSDGRLNREGQTRLREATFARAFDAEDIRAAALEIDSPEIASLVRALEEVAPDWAQLRSAVADGAIRAEMDITGHVQEAVRLIAQARETATREGSRVATMIDELLADIDLLDGALAPLSAALVRKIAPGGRVAPADKVAAFLRRYAGEAMKVGDSSDALFDAPGPLQVLARIDADVFGDLTETGRPRGQGGGGTGRFDAAADAPDFADGVDAPVVAASDAQMFQSLFGAEAPDAADAAPAGADDGPSVRAALADLSLDADQTFDLGDGTSLSPNQVRDELERDDALLGVADACPTGRGL